MTSKSARVLGWSLVAGGALFLAGHSAYAQENPLGFYVGAGAGVSTIRQQSNAYTQGLGLSRGATGWDAFMGIRPLPYLGAEIGYLDFGDAHRHSYTPTPYASDGEWLIHESADAPVGFAVGYLPIQPWWDLYLKAGVARLHKSIDVYAPAICAEGCFAPSDFPDHVTNWDFAYGVGSQIKFGALAWRLEYVRVNANNDVGGGDPDLLSVGVSWTFF